METQKRTLSKRAEALALVFLLACLGALGLHAATQTTNFDPAAATAGNARLLYTAIGQYVQGNDELLPPTQSVAVFEAALRPYVPDPAIFVSRITGQPFVPNPAIGGKNLGSFSDLSTVPAFRDVPPSAASATVAFLDGHIEQGGIVQDKSFYTSYSNAYALSVGVIQYVQDYDEKYPPMTTQAAFQTALYPFVKNTSTFIDPANGKPFVPNPALSEVSQASIRYPHTTILLESDTPYKNGIPTIAYVDGHVTPAPPSVKSQIDYFNLKQIGLATIQYTQDFDEFYPDTTNYTAFVDEIEPYTGDISLFYSPGTNLPYVLNPALSGVNLASIPDPANTEEARDAQISFDGKFNRLQADGRVKQDLFFVPKVLSLGPEDETTVLWPKAPALLGRYTDAPSGETAFWTVPSNGGSLTKTTYVQPANSQAITVSLGTDDATRLLWNRGYEIGFFAARPAGAITLDTVAPDNTLSNETQFGPYDGWKPLFLTTGADNSSRLLWQRYDGGLALWTLSPEGNYVGYVPVPTLSDGTPVGMTLGKDGLTRLLWKTSTGNALLWILSANGTVLQSFSAPSPHGFTLTGLGLDSRGYSRLLWGDGKDNAVVAAVAGVGGHFFFKEVSFTLPGGGTASQIAVGKAGDLRVLWENADGSGQLQTLTAGGKQTGDVSLTPYQ